MPLLEVKDLSFSYPGRPVLEGVSLEVSAGELVGLVGPNGSGKSTLLQLMLGMLKPDRGVVELDGVPVSGLSRREIARRAAFVPQDTTIPFSFSVREVVDMGRFPHLGRFQVEGPSDEEIIASAMKLTQTVHLADRAVNELSGGERQRVFIARAFAQVPKLMVLDEPTSNLDLVHQLEAMLLIRDMAARESGVIVAMHDLSLASRFCHRVLILADRRIAACGTPEAVFTAENLRDYFGIKARIEKDPGGQGLHVVPLAPAK